MLGGLRLLILKRPSHNNGGKTARVPGPNRYFPHVERRLTRKMEWLEREPSSDAVGTFAVTGISRTSGKPGRRRTSVGGRHGAVFSHIPVIRFNPR